MGKIYIGEGGVAKPLNKLYVGVSEVAKKVLKAYVGDVNGVARLVYRAYTPPSYTSQMTLRSTGHSETGTASVSGWGTWTDDWGRHARFDSASASFTLTRALKEELLANGMTKLHVHLSGYTNASDSCRLRGYVGGSTVVYEKTSGSASYDGELDLATLPDNFYITSYAMTNSAASWSYVVIDNSQVVQVSCSITFS